MLDLSDRYALPPDPGAIELRAFTHGLMPKTVPAMLQKFTDDWQERGVDAWNGVPDHWTHGRTGDVSWWELPAFLGDHFISPLLGAPVGTCIMQPNVHWSVQCVLSCPEVGARGTHIIAPETAFPSVLHSVQRWSSLAEYEVEVIASADDGFVEIEAIAAAVSNRTGLVILSHVGFITGEVLPDDEIRRLARRVHQFDGLLMLDGYHAAATMPINVRSLGVDLYAGGLLKAGSGSSGSAFCYVAPGINLTPRLSGWLADAQPFAFDRSPRPHSSVRRRFLGGTTAIAPLYHAIEGVRILLDTGLARIRDDSLEKTGYCIERCREAGIEVRSPTQAERRGAMVVLGIPEALRLSAYLKERRIYTDSRQNRYLRLTPFVWNDAPELKQAFDLIAEGVESGRYLDSALPEADGPVT